MQYNQDYMQPAAQDSPVLFKEPISKGRKNKQRPAMQMTGKKRRKIGGDENIQEMNWNRNDCFL